MRPLPILWFLPFLALGFSATAEEKPPNLIVFLADDLGWTGLRCFGSDFYETPNLDRMAEGGMKFTDAYAGCTVCSPSRAALMTGKYPGRLHLTSFIPGQDRPYARLNIPDWTKGLEPEHTTVAETLKAGGYRTIHVGKWHLDFPGRADQGPLTHGFDFSEDKPAGTKGYYLSEKWVRERGLESNYLTDYLTDVAVEQIEASGEGPFFLYFAFHVPHTPIQGREDLVAYFEGKVDPAATHRNPIYAAMVKSMDQSVGRVLDTLAAKGLRENTVILFTSDNGGLTQRHGVHDNFTENLPLRRGKGSAYEGGVRVPMIVNWPGVTAARSVCEEPVMGIDFLPSLVEMAGLDPVTGVDGRSFAPLLRDPAAKWDRDLFWHFPHYHAGGDSPYTAIRSGDWRLAEFHETGALELYDLSQDLGESQDRSASHPEVAEKLHRKLVQWREQVEAQMPTENPNYDPAKAKKKRP